MSDPHVFHQVLVHDGRDVERLSTFCMEPIDYRRMGAMKVTQAVEADRRMWQRVVLAKYGPGWAVRTVRERGYIRSLYPGAAIRSKAPATASASEVIV